MFPSSTRLCWGRGILPLFPPYLYDRQFLIGRFGRDIQRLLLDSCHIHPSLQTGNSPLQEQETNFLPLYPSVRYANPIDFLQLMNLTFKSKNLEMSLMAPDLTTSVFGSSCNYIHISCLVLFSLLFFPYLFLCIPLNLKKYHRCQN